MHGKLIVLEGLDGSGKSTQMEQLKNHLKESGHLYRQIKLPDYGDPSSTLVRMYLDGAFGGKASDVNAYAASLFYAVDRYASYKRHWGADYEGGTLILADRYATSNAIHQMGKLPESEWADFLKWVEDLEYVKNGIPRPDLVLYLDMPVEISQRLMSRRYHGDEVKKDVHECDVAYLNQCRRTAAYAAQLWGWRIIPCAGDGAPRSIEEIGNQIFEAVLKEL